MSELFAQFKVLIFMLLILGFTVGMVSKQRITKFIAGMVFMPVLIGLVWHYVQYFRANLEPMESLLFTIGIVIVSIVIALRFLLGKEIWDEVIGAFIYDVLKWIFFLPFRMVRACIDFFRRAR